MILVGGSDPRKTAARWGIRAVPQRRWLFRDHLSRRDGRCLLCRRENEGDPGIPAVGSILRGEFLVAFDIEVTLLRDPWPWGKPMRRREFLALLGSGIVGRALATRACTPLHPSSKAR